MNLYRCKHCGKMMKYRSTKKWIKSFCGNTGIDTHLMLVGTSKKNGGIEYGRTRKKKNSFEGMP